jgi:hypothetical protein
MGIREQAERDSNDWARSSGKPGGREVERVFPRGEGQRQEPAPTGGYLDRREGEER